MPHLSTFPRRLRALRRCAIWTLDAVFYLCVAFGIAKAQGPLEILGAGVERAEDAPFVTGDFQFLPGDYLYCQFQIAGYAIQTSENSETRKVSLRYAITPVDSQGVPLTPAVTGEIKDELNAEDKNWTPKRRASFLLPSFIGAGEYRVHVKVEDLIGHTGSERDLPFHVGGVVLVPAASLVVQDFQFLRKEDDTDALEVPAYRPGDTVYARFNMTGFRLAPGNEYHLSYGLQVTRPDGRPYLTQPAAAELANRSFYPVPFVPGNLAITTARSAARGRYLLVLTVRDLAGAQTYELKRAFTLE